jgi:Lar family restriction alleviation protein
MPDLKPCPFCGNEDACVNGYDEAEVCWVLCPGCYTTTGNKKTMNEAIEFWNTRKE